MFSPDNLQQLSRESTSGKIPPVENWNPPLSGDMDLCIKANGDWYHEGTLMWRKPLVKLFSSILKKEGDDYFLVSPVEKWRIQVEDAPLLVTSLEIESEGKVRDQKIWFSTTTEDKFLLGGDHLLALIKKNEQLRPYVRVRHNLDALIGRNVFYELVAKAVNHEGVEGVWSDGMFFPLTK
jgi:hypothetical protein